MTSAGSRYANLGETTFVAPDGRVAVYLRRRILPDPDQVRGSMTTVRPGERADLVASRALGSSTQFYRLCDANGISDPFDVAEGGLTQIALPRQQAITITGGG